MIFLNSNMKSSKIIVYRASIHTESEQSSSRNMKYNISQQKNTKRRKQEKTKTVVFENL